MRPEERLERLIEQRENGENQPLFFDDELTATLVAAENLMQLRKINVPPEFARRLEGELRASVRAQKVSQQTETGRLIPLTPSQGSVSRPYRSLKRRTWVSTLGAVAVLLIAFASLLTISARSLPGDPLYNLKQAENRWALNFGGDPQNHANSAIGQLHSALADLSTVVNEGRDDGAIQQALNTVSTWTNNSREEVSALPAGSDLQTTRQSLEEALIEEDRTLRLLLNHVDWSMKVAFTHQLGALGDPVPAVTHVTMRAQDNGTLLITLTGAGFASGTQFVIDGKVAGIVSQRSAGTLVAVISGTGWSSGTHTVGVLNPDGTAAAIQVVFRLHEDDHNSSGGNNSGSATPTPGTEHDD